jgi:hypothetical protein
LAVGTVDVHAEDAVSNQLWANITLGKAPKERVYLELDIEPKVQAGGDEPWRNLDLTPLVEVYPAGWLDLEAEATVGKTHQRDGLNTFEVTPRIGFRLHLFKQVSNAVKHERVPLTRLDVSTLVRLEWRNFYYSDDAPSEHTARLRARLEGKIAISHATLAQDRTLYAVGDVEYYAPLGEDVAERFANKARVRLGVGFRISAGSKVEALYIRDWNRSSPEETGTQDARILDVRLKLLF